MVLNAVALPFFVGFVLVLVGMYLAIRRRWTSPGVTAGIGVMLSIILWMLFSLAQNTVILHAVFNGVLFGGIFSGATLAMAWYFQSSEGNKHKYAPISGDETNE